MKKLFVLLAGLLFFTAGSAQTDTKEVPLDPKVIYGQLDNGLTYYIRENALPEDRAEFYLVVNAGAVEEDEDQDGLAHFAEHMAFNGTANFEKKEIIDYLQSIGMQFGPEINAFTAQDMTTYMLQKVPLDDPAHIDTALMILYDWANNIAFEDEEIDAERGVIHEEWRTRRGAEFRMMNKANKVLYKGSKYAEHDVIGDIDIIDNFDYEVIRRFYNDWYRPDLQAVIAVGDFDAEVIRQKITELFSQVPPPEEPRAKQFYEIPDHNETYVTIQSDKEARYTMVQMYYKHDIVKDKDLDHYKRGIREKLYQSMLNNRLQELLQQEDPPFVYGMSFYTNLIRSKDAYVAYAIAKDDQILRTLETLVTENQRVDRYGFTQTELERAKKDLMVSVEKAYKEREKKKSDEYVWSYFSHFLSGDPAPGIEYRYELVKEELPDITLEEINDLAKEYITEDNRVVVVMAPEKEGFVLPTEEEVLATVASAETASMEPYDDKFTDQPLVAEEPAAGTIVKSYLDEEFGATEWLFENGVRAVIKPTDFKEDEILMSAYSFGGSSLYGEDLLISANLAADIASQSGIGNIDLVELQKMMAGKVVSVRPEIGGVSEGFSGSTTPADLETMLQMIYLYFTDPRFDQTAHKAFMERMKGFYENKALSPSSALWDTVTVTMANDHPRVRPMSAELLDEANFNAMKYIFSERFGDPSGFNFYFVGNIDPETARPLFEKYLGGLPEIRREETFVDHNIEPPAGRVSKRLERQMEVPKATVFIGYTGDFDYDDYLDRLSLTALCDILDVRYVETVREEEGGTYGVAVYPSQSHYPDEEYTVRIMFDCDPVNAEHLKGIIYREIEILKTEGPKIKDLNGVKENKLKKHKENLKENRYWLSVLKGRDYDQQKPHVYDYSDFVDQLTAERMKDAANRFFGDNIVEVTLLPENIDQNIANPNTQKEE